MFSSWFTTKNNDTELTFTPFISQKLEKYLLSHNIKLSNLSTNCLLFEQDKIKFLVSIEPRFRNNVYFEFKINEHFYPHRKTLKHFTKWLIDNKVNVSLNLNLNPIENVDEHYLEFKDDNDETIIISINEERNISFSSYPFTSFRKLL